MCIKRIVLTYLILSGLFFNVQSFNKAKMDSLFHLIEENDRGMGSISIFRDGKEMYQKSYGYRDAEHTIKANAETKYRVGSISKTFTAAIVMKLIEEGELALTTRLSDFYPQVKNADKITVEQLLRHRSGIFNITNDNFTSWNTQKHTKEQLLEKIITKGSTFKPGERFEYSNSNYILLTFITEDITGKSFSDLLQEIIVKPCGLKNTCVGNKINPQNNEALSYTKMSDWKPENETDMSIPLGAGFIVSTPTDLNIFFTSLFEEKIIKKRKSAFNAGY